MREKAVSLFIFDWDLLLGLVVGTCCITFCNIVANPNSWILITFLHFFTSKWCLLKRSFYSDDDKFRCFHIYHWDNAILALLILIFVTFFLLPMFFFE